MTQARPLVPDEAEEQAIFDQADEEADERATQEGKADADAGRVVPHEDVARWLDTWSTPNFKPAPREWLK